MGAAGAVPKQEQAPAASKSMQKAHQQTHAQQLALARNSEAQPDSGLDDDSKQIATRNDAQQGQKHAQLQISASKLRPAPQPEPDSESEPESEEDDEEAAARERWARLRGLAEPETSSSEEDGGASDSGTDAELPSDLDGEEVRLPFNPYSCRSDVIAPMVLSWADRAGCALPVTHALY